MTDFRPGSFQMIPPVIKNLIIINVLVFLAQISLGHDTGQRMEQLFALHDFRSAFFKPHQFITYMFLHAGWDHIFFNMFALWMFGAILENYWGGKRFLIFYVICGIGAGISNLAVMYPSVTHVIDGYLAQGYELQDILHNSGEVNVATLGASGAVFGCLAAFGYLFPNSYVYLSFLVPIKAKWAVIGYAALELFSGIRGASGDNVAHWAHLGGGLVGLLLVIYWNRNNRKNFY